MKQRKSIAHAQKRVTEEIREQRKLFLQQNEALRKTAMMIMMIIIMRYDTWPTCLTVMRNNLNSHQKVPEEFPWDGGRCIATCVPYVKGLRPYKIPEDLT